MPKVGKTINFKCFANTELKPINITLNGEQFPAYPLYAYVSYGSSSTSIKITHEGQQVYATKELKFADKAIEEFVNQHSKYVVDVISSELSIFGEYHKLPGLSKRLEQYQMYARGLILGSYLIDFWAAIRPMQGEYTLSDSQRLVEGNLQYTYEFIRALVLWPRNQSTAYEWVFRDGKKKFELFLKEYFLDANKKNITYNEKLNSALFEIIDNMIIKKICPNMV